MKAKEFGTKSYLVKVYYKDEEGQTRTYYENYIRKETAKLFADRFTDRIGTFEDVFFKGTIVDVFTFTIKQCRFEE